MREVIAAMLTANGVKTMPKYKVYYHKDPRFESDPNLTYEKVVGEVTHALLMEVDYPSLDKVYGQLQAGNPSSDIWREDNVRESNSLIRSKGLHHTSMSIGDCLLDTETNTVYECAPHGWKVIE
jgi:hypothetical protein